MGLANVGIQQKKITITQRQFSVNFSQMTFWKDSILGDRRKRRMRFW